MKLGIYQHYKGNHYQVIAIARHTETVEEMVVYQALYGDYGMWVRPKSMFEEKVHYEGVEMPRFAFIKECLTTAPTYR